MPQIGATIEEMQTLQAAFTRESGTVDQLSSSISGQVGSTWWVGPAADRFKSEWEGEFKPMLARLSAALTECSQEVSRRAEAISAAGS
ncbi:MAG TPA: WXG100 family type VII secretion target [Baekduia sp.]|jgi:WXG100 family type VII secretion target|nr:WXG100 family type VII secretion target [Baekduia sp.]